MTDILFDLTYEVAGLVANLEEGNATDGSISTLVDTKNREEDNGYWDDGTIWIIEADSAAPEQEWARIDDFEKSIATVTLRDNATVAIAAGDRYAIATSEFTLDAIISAINKSLRRLGPISTFDKTSITIASNQTEYDLPVAAKRDLRKVYIQRDNTDSDDNRWEEIFNWYPQPAAAGSVATLVLPLQYTDGYALALEYMAPHVKMYAASDKLNEVVPMERVIYRAATETLHAKYRATRIEFYVAEIQRYEDIAKEMELLYDIGVEPIEPGQLTLVGKEGLRYPGDRTPR